MDKSEIFYDLLREIQEKVDVDLDKEITLFLIKSKSKNCTVHDLISDLNLVSFEEALFQKYSSLKSALNENTLHNTEEEDTWQNMAEFDNYEDFLKHLSRLPCMSSELLDEMLKIQCIDTRQAYWPEVSVKLQECFPCLNTQLFLKSLQVHFRIISTRNSSADGYLSLLKATHKIVTSNNIGKIEKGNRVMLSMKIILETELFMLNTIHLSKDKIVDEIVDGLIALFSFKKIMTEGTFSTLDNLSYLDKKAEWFKYLCSSGYTKFTTFEKIEKYPVLLNSILDNFVIILNNPLYSFSDSNSPDIFHHSSSFLIYYFSNYQNITDFSYKNDLVDEYSFTKLIILTVRAINNHISLEVKETLRNFITLLFQENPRLVNHDILDILFTPFEDMNGDNSLKIIHNNTHIFKIVQFLAKVDDKILTNGYLYNRRKYKNIFQSRNFDDENYSEQSKCNIPQLIIDVTILMLRNYINTSERKQVVNDFVLSLLECCENIYNSHPVFLYTSITTKFILNLKNFYKALCNFNFSQIEREKLLNMFSFFFKYFPNVSNLLNDRKFTLDVLNGIITRSIDSSHSLIFHNFANNIYMEDALQIQLLLITHSFLVSAWHKNDWDGRISYNENLMDLLNFINGISYNEKLARVLVHEKEEYQILRKDVVYLPVLLRICVQNVRDTLETYTGLLILRILISSLDGLVYLQTRFNLKENFSKIQSQVEGVSESDSEPVSSFLDKCSIVRKNILMNIESVGYPNRKLNKIDDLLDKEKFNQQNIIATRTLGRKTSPPCELQKFLQKSRSALHDNSWILQMRKCFQTICSEDYNLSLINEIVYQFPRPSEGNFNNRSWPDSEVWLPQVCAEEKAAIAFVVSYGLHNQLLNVGHRHEENLAFLLKQSRRFLNNASQEFEGFDWFVGVCFLICSGNLEKCKLFLVKVSQLPTANLIWNKFGERYGSFWLETFLQHLDVILAENTVIYTALKMTALSPAVIVKKWLGQCFFNILEFREICNFIVFSIVYPLEWSVYYMMCLFMHNKINICTLTHTISLQNLLNVIALEDFKLASYFPVINKTFTRYRNIIKL